MKQSLRIAAFLLFLFAIIMACTKEVSLKTEVEFDVTVEHNAKGYVNEDLSTTITVVPEAVLEEFSYSYSYSVSKGEGQFMDQAGEVLPQDESIALDPFSATMKYVGANPGNHMVKVTATDNFGFFEELEIAYTVNEIPPVVWTVTSPVERIELGKSAVITVHFEKSEANVDMDFARRYRITGGSGTLTGSPEQGEVGFDVFEAIVPGTYTLSFTPTELGMAELAFDLKGDDGEVFTAEIAFEVVQDVTDTLAPQISLLGDNPQQVLLNAPYTESGATALDVVDGDLTDQIVIDESAVDTAQEGSYEVKYTVSDEDENTAIAIRTVIVTNSIAEVAVTGINVLPETASVAVGTTQQLTAAIIPNNATEQGVLWSSSNTAAATVDGNGLVTAVAAGDAIITATSVANSSITDTASITVTPSQVQVTAIAVNSTRASIPDNETEQFTAVVNPMNATSSEVTWSSSNTGVATIDASTGLVTAISPGATNIVAAATDGSGVTGSAGLTVTASPIAVTGITVSSGRASIPDNETEHFTAEVTPVNADNSTVTWSSSNPAVATVNISTGVVTAVSAGTTTIIATAMDGSNVTGSTELTVTASTIFVNGIIVSSIRSNIPNDEMERFTATVSPVNADNRTVSWSSSNLSVATVNSSSGMVTALSAGTTTIVATANDGSSISGSKLLIVTQPPNFIFNVNPLIPEPTNGYNKGMDIDLVFNINESANMPSGTAYTIVMTGGKISLSFGTNNYRENQEISMNTGRSDGAFSELLFNDSVTVTFTITESITGIVKTQTLTFRYCTGCGL